MKLPVVFRVILAVFFIVFVVYMYFNKRSFDTLKFPIKGRKKLSELLEIAISSYISLIVFENMWFNYRIMIFEVS